jgi:hypothetical protein
MHGAICSHPHMPYFVLQHDEDRDSGEENPNPFVAAIL